MTMVSYVPKREGSIAVSTVHSDDKIYETTQQLRKPEIINTYKVVINVCL
jgi:hypothetical protein